MTTPARPGRDPVETGVSGGCVLAVVISWSLNHSLLWAILHGFCSWFYVIYYAIYLEIPK